MRDKKSLKWLILALIGGLFSFGSISRAQLDNSNANLSPVAIAPAEPLVDQGALTENDASMEATETLDREIQDLQSQIDEQQKRSEELEDKMKLLNRQIKERQKEQVSLKNELQILDDQVTVTTTDLDLTSHVLSQLELEIDQLNRQIDREEGAIDRKKDQLTQLMRSLYALDGQTPLEVAMTHRSFSSFFSQITYTEQIQEDVQSMLKEVRRQKDLLTVNREQLNVKEEEAERRSEELKMKQEDLNGQKAAKDGLLLETEENEDKFRDLREEAKREFLAASDAVVSIEKTIRKKLREKESLAVGEAGRESILEESGDEDLIWPVSGREITAGFKDPDYPFRYLFEHPAIDIRTGQGSSVKAAASGVVGIAKEGGQSGYSYVMIVHANNLSTVYGHMSRIDVEADEEVQQGQIIGLSGGMPGTPGAGKLTTGPHMHFEVRLDGIPVNPINYLP